jgi:hypothetical protein
MKPSDLRNKAEGSSCPRNVGNLSSHSFNLKLRNKSLPQEDVLVGYQCAHISPSIVEVCLYMFILKTFFEIVCFQLHTYVEAKYSSPSVIRVRGWFG